MHSHTKSGLLGSALILALASEASAHGYVNTIISGGVSYPGANPGWISTPITTAGWFAYNQDNGFVAPAEYTDTNITCHKLAKVGNDQVPVVAGATIRVEWSTFFHPGPVIDYIAKAPATYSDATSANLEFVKIDQTGLISTNPDYWAGDLLSSRTPLYWDITIPASLAPGNYVLRHEIIALHTASAANGAQNYPQCINLKVTGSGTADISASAEPATDFYTPTDPGILINIYAQPTTYTFPGPPLWSGTGGSSPPPSSTKSVVPPSSTVASSTPVPPKSSSTTFKTSTTSTTSTKASSSAPAASCAAKYAQCGGQGWTGATCCVAGSTCKANGQYYSQCV